MKKVLNIFFDANKIEDAKIRVSTLLSLVGQAIYKLLCDLCFSTPPKEKKYEELCDLLEKQYGTHTSVWRERIKFHDARHEVGETVATWFARIKSMAVTAKFVTNLADVLKDKFVCGLLKGKIQERLCEKDVSKDVDGLFKLAMQKECTLDAQINKIFREKNFELTTTLAPRARGDGNNKGWMHCRRRQQRHQSNGSKWPVVRNGDGSTVSLVENYTKISVNMKIIHLQLM